MASAIEPIAIIGTGCRFPGNCSSSARLWELLRSPQNVASKVPADRFNVDAFYHPDGTHHGTTNVKEGYFLKEDVRAFDASFFNISPTEAASMDPQQRLLLETVYESLEAAGLQLEALQGSSTGVFCGFLRNDYSQIQTTDRDALPAYTVTGNSLSIMANRVSYFFDWKGPSFGVDTGCSSSLLAVHLAVDALHKGDCSMAMAVGSNLILSPTPFIADSATGMLSPTGRSRMWDESADGYARGEGVAAVVLKRLSDALADGDEIECLIRATAANADGRTMGITMPNGNAQQELIHHTYTKAGLDPKTPEGRCQYFEAHGTGTQAGDPQEAGAIFNAFFGDSPTTDLKVQEKLYVGSIKTVIGHTEATAGLAGLIKASLCLQHSKIVPNMLLERLNPKLCSLMSCLHVPTENMPWPELPAGAPRRASVNSFGFGGANVHAILESYDAPATSPPTHSPPFILPFTFSAASERSLGAVLQQYGRYLQDAKPEHLLDLAATLVNRRSVFSHRVSLTASSLEELRSKVQREIEQNTTKYSSTVICRSKARSHSVLGVFTGQGAQWPQMGLDLIMACPEARMWMDEMQQSLNRLPAEYRPDFDMMDELSKPEDKSRVHEAAISQPLRTAIQIIQVNFLRALGISFTAVVGHSSGEIAAAYASGLLNSSDAIRIAYLRGNVAKYAGSTGQQGAMMAVGLSAVDADAICSQESYVNRVSVAAYNSPSSVTLSGDQEVLTELEWLLRSLGRQVKVLCVDTAYHSHHMLPCAEPYLRALKKCNISIQRPQTSRWFSSVLNGREMMADDDFLQGDYWKENMVRSVGFSQAMAMAIDQNSGPDLIMEVGPHPALKGPAIETLSTMQTDAQIPYIGLTKRNSSSIECFAAVIGSLWTYLESGCMDLSKYVSLFDPAYHLKFVKDLPSYPFDHREQFWVESRLSKAVSHRCNPPNCLLGVLSPDSGKEEQIWRGYLRRDDLQWLMGYEIRSLPLFPPSGYISLALESAKLIAGQEQLQLIEVHDLAIENDLPIPDNITGVETVFKVGSLRTSGKHIHGTFSCQAGVSGQLISCASGVLTMTLGSADAAALPARRSSVPDMRAVDIEDFYSALTRFGHHYSEDFKCLKALSRRRDGACGSALNSTERKPGSPLLHPATAETSLQVLMAALENPSNSQSSTLYRPRLIRRTVINLALCDSPELMLDASILHVKPEGIHGVVDVFNSSGQGVMQLEGVHLVPQVEGLVEGHSAPLFSETIWGPVKLDATLGTSDCAPNIASSLELRERLTLLHLRDIGDQLSLKARQNLDRPRAFFVAWMDHVLAAVRDNDHPTCRSEWLGENIQHFLSIDHGLHQSELLAMDKICRRISARLLCMGGTQEEVFVNEGLAEYYQISGEFSTLCDRLVQVVGQILFLFPRLNVLEVRRGTDIITKRLIRDFGHAFHSYTCADTSDVPPARKEQNDQSKSLISYTSLDLCDDIIVQGYQEHSQDLVVVTNAGHGSCSLPVTLSNMRRLLKPGGYIVIIETTNPTLIYPKFFSGTPQNWKESVRTRSEWNTLLLDSGFSGIDTANPAHEAAILNMSLFVSQAVDDQIQLLRSPLSMCSAVPNQDLFFVCDTNDDMEPLRNSLYGLLKPRFNHIVSAENLDAMEFEGFCAPTVLVLTYMNDSWFQTTTHEQCIASIQKTFKAAGKLLWVTVDAQVNPHRAMTKGMLRNISLEYPNVTFQHLEIPNLNDVNFKILATTLMRLVHAKFENNCRLPGAVTAMEPEVRYVDGAFLVPRQQTSSFLNKRHFAHTHIVDDDVGIEHTLIEPIKPERVDSPVRVVTHSISSSYSPQSPRVILRVQYSTLRAVRVDTASYLYLVVGRDVQSQSRVIAVTDKNAGLISVDMLHTRPIPSWIAEGQEPDLLLFIACALITEQILSDVHPGTSLLVHEPDSALYQALATAAPLHMIDVFFSTSKSPPADGMMFIHKNVSSLALSRQLPSDLSVIAASASSSGTLFRRATSLLCEDIRQVDIDSFFRASPQTRQVQVSDLRGIAYALKQTRALHDTRASITGVDAISRHPGALDKLEIVDWTASKSIPAQIRSASSHVSLSAAKSYLLLAMQKDLALSVSEWMVSRGARHVVLAGTASDINFDKGWVEEMATRGASIHCLTT
jgi:acyl transferase domain-containing protein